MADGNVALAPRSLLGPCSSKDTRRKSFPALVSYTARIDEAVWRVLLPDLVGGETEETRKRGKGKKEEKGEKKKESTMKVCPAARIYRTIECLESECP